jgi:hypothetical protein
MRRYFSVLMSVLVLALPVTVLGAQEPAAPKTDLQKFLRSVEELNAQAANAGTKLRHGVVSMKSDSETDNAPLTPARACCAANIDKIGKQFQVIGDSIRTLRSCYQSNGNADAEVKLNFVHEDATAVYNAVGHFGAAQSVEGAQAGYSNLARTILLLKKSAKTLGECGASGGS